MTSITRFDIAVLFMGLFFIVQVIHAQPPQDVTAKVEGTWWDFTHTVETTARPEAIWQVWTDVEHWPAWDTELESAGLQGTFHNGSRGFLRSSAGAEAEFVISDCIDMQQYTFSTNLPLGSLLIKRTLTSENNTGKTRFTHHVQFVGASGWLFGLLLGPRYKAVLPSVMERIRSIAEKSMKKQ